MHPFVEYAAYVLRHKWLILKFAPTWGVPLWQALIHDWSRFTPTEFLPSANYFFGAYGRGVTWRRGESPAYDAARDLHETRNPHHAQYWHGQPIPERYLREMLCDWDAAGQAKGNPIGPWYATNRDRLGLHPATLARIDQLLEMGERGSHSVANPRSCQNLRSCSSTLPVMRLLIILVTGISGSAR